MKKIEAVIKPFMLDNVVSALQEINIDGLTLFEVRGFGKQRGHSEIYRGAEYSIEYMPKLWITLVVPDEQEKEVIEAIAKEAWTGKIGDGKIFVSSIKEIREIRTKNKVVIEKPEKFL